MPLSSLAARRGLLQKLAPVGTEGNSLPDGLTLEEKTPKIISTTVGGKSPTYANLTIPCTISDDPTSPKLAHGTCDSDQDSDPTSPKLARSTFGSDPSSPKLARSTFGSDPSSPKFARSTFGSDHDEVTSPKLVGGLAALKSGFGKAVTFQVASNGSSVSTKQNSYGVPEGPVGTQSMMSGSDYSDYTDSPAPGTPAEEVPAESPTTPHLAALKAGRAAPWRDGVTAGAVRSTAAAAAAEGPVGPGGQQELKSWGQLQKDLELLRGALDRIQGIRAQQQEYLRRLQNNL